jgi:hypothetical protein
MLLPPPHAFTPVWAAGAAFAYAPVVAAAHTVTPAIDIAAVDTRSDGAKRTAKSRAKASRNEPMRQVRTRDQLIQLAARPWSELSRNERGCVRKFLSNNPDVPRRSQTLTPLSPVIDASSVPMQVSTPLPQPSSFARDVSNTEYGAPHIGRLPPRDEATMLDVEQQHDKTKTQADRRLAAAEHTRSHRPDRHGDRGGCSHSHTRADGQGQPREARSMMMSAPPSRSIFRLRHRLRVRLSRRCPRSFMRRLWQQQGAWPASSGSRDSSSARSIRINDVERLHRRY